MAHLVCIFFFNDTATTEIYTLSLHDALPICGTPRRPDGAPRHRGRGSTATGHAGGGELGGAHRGRYGATGLDAPHVEDRKSTRLNSSHANISYAVFCLKKKKKSQLHPLRSVR